jgi:diaminohydroxyphosphoribosylaminopyrimidine deaminase/5-amino-6-(5-phosphoribosylamino)uracil reductase
VPDCPTDERFMRLAMANAATVRLATSPNPWVGCVVVSADGDVFQGATSEPGGPHAEVDALSRAGEHAVGATLYVTLEPCAHTGRTPPCVDAIIDARVQRVVVAIEDPDSNVAGRGVRHLRDRGVDVTTGVLATEVARQLAPYLTHRRTGRPHVVLKLALTLDGFIAAPDGSSNWITGAAARADAHRLRAESDAIVVGAGTVRTDDPMLTVRDFTPAHAAPTAGLDPLRVVLGRVPPGARIAPAIEHQGDLAALLDDLGRRGVLQLMVEGGAHVAGQFHRGGFVDEYVLYLAPAFMGGERGRQAFAGPGAPTMAELTRGRFVSVDRLGDDLRIVVVVDR